MARPADWSPLADTDPVPGDPLEVAALGARFQATADEIASAVRRLRTMCTDEFWDSGAGASFRRRSIEAAGKLDAAHARYAAAATALGADPSDPSPSTASRPNYAAALAQAQDLAEGALHAAQAAARSQREVMARLAGGDQVLPPELARQYNAAAEAITAARAAVVSAARIRDVAAANASGLISRVISVDALGDSWRDYVLTFTDEHAGLLSVTAQVASQVAALCVPLALAMGGEGSRPGSLPAPLAAGYELTVPEGWYRIDVRPGVRDLALAPLAAGQVRDELQRVAERACANGGLELYISPQTAAGFPLPAALVVTRTAAHGAPRVVVSAKRLADDLAAEGGEVTVTEYPAGRAVRVRRRAKVTSLDIHFPVPDSGAYLMLSFSTPLDELADAMVGLFDSIASTLRWLRQPPQPDQRRANPPR